MVTDFERRSEMFRSFEEETRSCPICGKEYPYFPQWDTSDISMECLYEDCKDLQWDYDRMDRLADEWFPMDDEGEEA